MLAEGGGNCPIEEGKPMEEPNGLVLVPDPGNEGDMKEENGLAALPEVLLP